MNNCPQDQNPAPRPRRAFQNLPLRLPGPNRPARLLADAGVLGPLGLLALLVVLAPILLLWRDGTAPWPLALGFGCSLLVLAALWVAGWRLYQRLLLPLTILEDRVNRLCQGEPGANLALEQVGVLGRLIQDVRCLGDELFDLYDDMDQRVERQTRRLAQKTASLNILYGVAASINQAEDLDLLLLRYLRTLKEMVNGRTASVRLQGADGRIRLVGCVGLDNQTQVEADLLPLTLCRCGEVVNPGDILCPRPDGPCLLDPAPTRFRADQVEMIEVPIAYRDQTLGHYRIYLDQPGIAGREDIRELLTTIGSHLGMAVAKQRSDAEARRLSIMEERAHLAHELHDSLAQTLASLRIQVRMLEETAQDQPLHETARGEILRIRHGLDEAHTELRELLNSFRAPLDQRGLVPALERLVESFRQDTGIHSLFHRDCRRVELGAREEMQMLRIVQEALTNIRKYADAHTVRVLLRCRAPGTYLLLVEDDGVGFQRAVADPQNGEHIGLHIMEERARRIGAELRIESEPGEGTRVELLFKPAHAPRESCPQEDS